MDIIFPALDPNKCLKTYGKVDRKPPSEASKNAVLQLPQILKERKPLTTKNAVEHLLNGTLKSKVCRYCLNLAPDLSHLDQILQVAGKGTFYKVAIKDIVASFYPCKVTDDPNFPNKICENCLDRAVSCYLFIQQCDQAQRALRNCFEDIYEKLVKLDPVEPVKKRGRHKLHPNHNTINAEHKEVMDYAEPVINIMNTTEILTNQTPISDLECLKCCEVLPSIESLINHSKTHPSSMWFNCRLCGMSFPKRSQIKKHFNTKHATPRQESKLLYDCKRCGLNFDKCYEYLQHIEKHRFKTVMEHLVEKKMDKLCALCFNKGSNMMPLEETICLHGGCAELTGDRPLYAILASTLPEKKYKYRELLIPTQASMVRIIKKKKCGTTNIAWSNPIVVSLNKFICNKQYMYIFSKPSHNDRVKIDNVNNSNNIFSQTTEVSNHNQTNFDTIDITKFTDDVTRSQEVTVDSIKINSDNDSNNIVTQVTEVNNQDHSNFDISKFKDEIDNSHNNSVDNIKIGVIHNMVTEITKTNDRNQPDVLFIDKSQENEISAPHSANKTSLVEIKAKTIETEYDEVYPHVLKEDYSEKLKIKDTNENYALNETQTVNFTFSNPAPVDIDRINIIKPEKSNESWIFNQTSKQTSDDTKSTLKESLNINSPTIAPCKICWVFQNLTKCHNCGKSDRSTQYEPQDVFNPLQNKANSLQNITESIQNDKINEKQEVDNFVKNEKNKSQNTNNLNIDGSYIHKELNTATANKIRQYSTNSNIEDCGIKPTNTGNVFAYANNRLDSKNYDIKENNKEIGEQPNFSIQTTYIEKVVSDEDIFMDTDTEPESPNKTLNDEAMDTSEENPINISNISFGTNFNQLVATVPNKMLESTGNITPNQLQFNQLVTSITNEMLEPTGNIGSNQLQFNQMVTIPNEMLESTGNIAPNQLQFSIGSVNKTTQPRKILKRRPR